MSYSTANADADLRRLGNYRVRQAVEIGAAGEPDEISGDLLIAIASRESNCRNVNGGGFYRNDGGWENTKVDAGCFQINRQYHESWLKSVPGCDESSWAEKYHGPEGALPKDRVPGFTRAAKKARSILRYNRTYALGQGVLAGDALRVAIAGYNRGAASAVAAYKRGEDPDQGTTGRDYSVNVLERRQKIKVVRHRLGW